MCARERERETERERERERERDRERERRLADLSVQSLEVLVEGLGLA